MTEIDAARLQEIDRARVFAMQQLRVLTINILRIARGSGEPQYLFRQTSDYVARAKAYRDLTEMDFTLDVFREALDVYKACPEALLEHKLSRDIHDAQETAISTSLQVAASRLQNDRLREAKGASELDRAFERWSKRGR